VPVVVMLSIFSVVGVIGNALAFYIFFRRRSTSTSVIFILALAGTDFITCLVTIPYTVVFELLSYRVVYDLACKSYMFLITSTVPFSAYIMVAIALDRYFCICHPFLHAFTIPRAKALILCMGVPAITFGIITALSYGTYIYDERENCTEDNAIDCLPLTSEAEAAAATTNATERSIKFYGVCVANKFYFSDNFSKVYQRIHALNFLIAYVAVAVLYIMIYKSIFTRRANKARRKKNNLYPVSASKLKDQPAEETQMTVIQTADKDSPKLMNNQTRKDAKCARKITLTARNDPAAFVKSGPRAVHLPDVQEEERTNLLPSRDEGGQTDVASEMKSTTAAEDLNTSSQTDFRNSPSKKVPVDDSSQRNDSAFNGHVKTSDNKQYQSDNEYANKTDEELNTAGIFTNGTAPEEKPLLPQPTSLHAPSTPAPPNTLSLKPTAVTHICSGGGGGDDDGKGPRKHSGGLGKHVTTDVQTNSIKRKRPSTVRDRNLMANIKTAFMLFIVTLVFIVAFLPALLMANKIIPINLIVFYGYFIYNVANPFIYAFMNQTFRDDLKKIISVC
ncbi:hypothetical protein Btru_042512, partial [Bulinus truncatus]